MPLDEQQEEVRSEIDSREEVRGIGDGDNASAETKKRTEGQAEEARSPEVLEAFKRVHDSIYRFAHTRALGQVDAVTAATLRERRCAEPYTHSNLGFDMHFGRIGLDKKPRYFTCDVGFPIGAVEPNRINNLPIPFRDNDVIRDWGEVGQESVLVGVRETIQVEEGVSGHGILSGLKTHTKLWVLAERLQVVDFPQPVDNVSEVAPPNGRGSIPDFSLVRRLVLEDGELMLLRKVGSAFVNQRNDNVVERRSEIVYEVSADDAEDIFFRRIVGRLRVNPKRAPIAAFFVLRAGHVEVTIRDNDGGFSLQGLKVYARPCNLCVGLRRSSPNAIGSEVLPGASD